MDFRLVKIVETVLLTGMFAAFGTYALEVGADPTIVSLFVLTGMLAVAGVNFHEVASVAEALRSGSIVIQTGDGDGDDE